MAQIYTHVRENLLQKNVMNAIIDSQYVDKQYTKRK